MSSIDELLEAEVERVPVDLSAGREGVRARVRARQRRRRAGAAGAVAVVALIGLAVVRAGDDREQPVITGPGPTEQSTTTTVGASTDPATTDLTTDLTTSSARPTVTISPDPVDLADGELVTVTGVGFPAGVTVSISVCDGNDITADCDVERSVAATPDDGGGFIAPMRLYRDMATYDGRRACGSCELHVVWYLNQQMSQPLAPIPIEFRDAGGIGLQPSLVLDPQHQGGADGTPASIRIGERFSVRGMNLQVGQEYHFGICSPPLGEDPATRPCLFPDWGTVVTNDSGSFTATGSLIADFLRVCPEGTVCGLTMGGTIGIAPVAEVAITLLGP